MVFNSMLEMGKNQKELHINLILLETKLVPLCSASTNLFFLKKISSMKDLRMRTLNLFRLCVTCPPSQMRNPPTVS